MFYVKCLISRFSCNHQRFENQYDIVIGKCSDDQLVALTKKEVNQFVLFAKSRPYNFQFVEFVIEPLFGIDLFDPIRDGRQPPPKCIISTDLKEPFGRSVIGEIFLISENEEVPQTSKLLFTLMGLFI
jgi:hypothetical protein